MKEPVDNIGCLCQSPVTGFAINRRCNMDKLDRTTGKTEIHAGPNPGILAVVFTALFNLGLYFVITFNPNAPHFPNPSEPGSIITAYFRDNANAVLMCAFFQFGSAVPLGLFIATV